MIKICLRLFSLQKIDKNKSFIKKQLPEGFFKSIPQNSPENTCFGVPFLIKFQAWGLQLFKRETSTQVFPGEFCKIFNIIFFREHLLAIASFRNLSHSFILQRSFIYLFKPSFVRKINKKLTILSSFHFQIHFILHIVNAIYRSKHKHKKSYFVNQTVKLYL